MTSKVARLGHLADLVVVSARASMVRVDVEGAAQQVPHLVPVIVTLQLYLVFVETSVEIAIFMRT